MKESQPSSAGRRITGKSLCHNSLRAHSLRAHHSLRRALRDCLEMENKINGRMSASMPDSTDKRVSELIGAGYNNAKPSNESLPLTCMSSSVRNFGDAGALIHGLNSGGDCATLDGSLAHKHFYDRGSDFMKCDSVPWEDFVAVQRTSASESLPGASLSLSSTACKFIKDEKEPSVIMDTSFDPSSDMPDLDSCCDADRKQQPGLGDVEPAGFSPGLQASPNFLIDLNQTEQLSAPSQARTDSRCPGLSGKAVVSFDANAYASQLTAYKSEVSRWPMQTSPAEPQYWYQSAGASDDLFTHGGYDGVQSQALCQRNPSPFSTFPG